MLVSPPHASGRVLKPARLESSTVPAALCEGQPAPLFSLPDADMEMFDLASVQALNAECVAWMEIPGTSLHLSSGDTSDLEFFEKALAARFGVNRRFVQVRLQRYGLIRPENFVR